MSAVQFHCPLCNGLFQVDDALSGMEVNCPHCAGLVTVPEFAPPTPSHPVGAVQLNCPICGGPFQATPEMSGQQVSCPHCSQVVTVPDLGLASAPPELPPSLPAPADHALYPPGYAPPERQPVLPLQPPERKAAAPTADSLLPPAAGEVPAAPPSESLLPPGAESETPAAERVPLPASIPARSAKEPILIPTEKGYVGVHEPVKTIQHRGQQVELRRLTPEERARRRMVRNVALFVVGVMLLMVVMAAFTWRTWFR